LESYQKFKTGFFYQFTVINKKTQEKDYSAGNIREPG